MVQAKRVTIVLHILIILLSLTAKSALAWQVYAGALAS